MHELKIIQNVFPIIVSVARESNLRSVNKVVLRIGALRQVILEFLRFAFVVTAEDSIAAGAELEIELIPVTILCKSCQKKFNVEENVYICPECNGVDITVLTGQEIILAYISGKKN